MWHMLDMWRTGYVFSRNINIVTRNYISYISCHMPLLAIVSHQPTTADENMKQYNQNYRQKQRLVGTIKRIPASGLASARDNNKHFLLATDGRASIQAVILFLN